MKIVKYTFKGDDWKAYLVPHDEVEEFLGPNTLAEVQWDKKEIYFDDSELTKEIVKHELIHMSIGYQYVHDSGLNFHQSEELFCNIFAFEGDILLSLSSEIYNSLILLKNSDTLEEVTIGEKIENHSESTEE